MSDDSKYILRRHVTPNLSLRGGNDSVCANVLGISHRADMQFWIEPQFDILLPTELPDDYETPTDVVTYRWQGSRISWAQEYVASVCRSSYRVGTYDNPHVGVNEVFSETECSAVLTSRYGSYPTLELLSVASLTYWQWRISLRLTTSRTYIKTYTDKTTGLSFETTGEVAYTGEADFFSAHLTSGPRLNNGTALFAQHISGTLLGAGARIKACAGYD